MSDNVVNPELGKIDRPIICVYKTEWLKNDGDPNIYVTKNYDNKQMCSIQ